MRHELHLAVHGFRAALVVTALLAAVGTFVASTAGLLSALAGAGIVMLNHGLAALSTGWSRRLGAGTIAVGYAAFVFRMALVLGLLAALAQWPAVDRAMVAISFCATLVVSLGAEWRAWATGSYVPKWRAAHTSAGSGRIA